MQLLQLHNVTFDGSKPVYRGIHDSLQNFSGEFSFGKSYLIDAELGKGAWALTRIVGGALHSDSGEIIKDGLPYLQQARYLDTWFVRESEFRGFRAGYKTVKTHLQRGLKANPVPYLTSEEAFIERFNLSPERYNRTIRHLSNEGWRASCAIGLAHGKKIFCFPYLEYVRPYLIEEYYELWLKAMVDLLRDSGALVLIPAIARGLAEKLCDEIVSIQRQNG